MEYNKVIVPLDGSKLAESVLPHVEKIAKGCSIPQVILITITEPVQVKTPVGERLERLPERMQSQILYYGNVSTTTSGIVVTGSLKDLPVTIGKMAKTGYDYLARQAQQLQEKGLQVSVAVLIGNVAEEIVRFAKSENADLIVMAS